MSAQRLSFTLAMRKIFCQSIGDGTVLCGQIDAAEDKYAANSLGDEKLFVRNSTPQTMPTSGMMFINTAA